MVWCFHPRLTPLFLQIEIRIDELVMTLRLSLLFLLLIALGLSSCDYSDATYREMLLAEENQDHNGLLLVSAHRRNVTLGTKDKEASLKDRPLMKVSFSYDYYLGKHEVTCKEYRKYFKEFKCDGDSLPVTNVTFFDAVLLANARSKAEKYDTAYTYTAAEYDDDGHCVGLNGFSFDPQVESYRLPTEAEWMLAAGHGWNTKLSWHAENSEYKAHKVCSNGETTAGFCDLTGNVKEWVNDWLGQLKDTTISNYGGAPDGGLIGERVLKGGSFRDLPGDITLYGRGDIYTVISSMKADYVGFRLAFGKIPDVNWLGRDGVAGSSRVYSLVDAREMKNLIGKSQVKLAFRNDMTGNLAFIDYSSGASTVVEIADTIDVYHPDISPDGKKVAFCTKFEGVEGTSKLYVRNLNARAGGLVQLDVESAAIPRWRVTLDGDTVIVYVTDAGVNTNEASFKKQSTWQVKFEGGKFGKPEKLLDGAYHDGVSAGNNLFVSGARLLRARVGDVDTIWYNSEQACNAALAKDGSNRTLFLDFGGKTGHEFAGEKYSTHKRLLVVDRLGNLIQTVKAPDGYTFDHSEWANSIYAVATLTNAGGNHEKIALVNLQDSAVTEIISGEELWHPCVWVQAGNYVDEEEDSYLNFDSAGVYYTSKVPFYGLELREKMERFWLRRDSITAVVLGSSRALFGIDDRMIKSMNTLNMAFSSGDIPCSHFLFQRYVLNHLNIKYAIIEVSPDFFNASFSLTLKPVLDNAPGYKYDEDHYYWTEEVSDAFLDAVVMSPKPFDAFTLHYDPKDFMMPSGKWGSAAVLHDLSWVTMETETVRENFIRMKDIINHSRSKGIKVICLVTPQNPGYRKTKAFGLYGAERSVAKDILDSIERMGAIMFDENKFGLHDYTDEMAFNTDHLSALGAKQLTRRLDSLLMSLQK